MREQKGEGKGEREGERERDFKELVNANVETGKSEIYGPGMAD